MIKILFTLQIMTSLTLAYGQEVKAEKENFKVIKAEKVMVPFDKSKVTLLNSHVVVDSKLDIEADTIVISDDKRMLTAYGAKTFTFNGKVLVAKHNNGICKFRLGESTLIVE